MGGYAAPDYIETGHLTAKSDVWTLNSHKLIQDLIFNQISIPTSPNSENNSKPQIPSNSSSNGDDYMKFQLQEAQI